MDTEPLVRLKTPEEREAHQRHLQLHKELREKMIQEAGMMAETKNIKNEKPKRLTYVVIDDKGKALSVYKDQAKAFQSGFTHPGAVAVQSWDAAEGRLVEIVNSSNSETNAGHSIRIHYDDEQPAE